MTQGGRQIAGPPSTRTDAECLAASILMAGFLGHSVPPETADLIARGVRSLVLFARNIDHPDQVASLTAEIRALAGDDALIAVDREGGRVDRLRQISTAWPSPMTWAAVGDADLARRGSAALAAELRALGINLNFAPVADLLEHPDNPVLGTRCFSDDPATVAAFTAAFVEGHRRAGVAATAKHFPGHGGTAVDSHLDLPRIDRSLNDLRRADLIPFQAAVAAGVDCLMVSHVWYSGLDGCPTSASISRRVVDLARTDLAYGGVVVTDSMEMGAIVLHMPTPQAVVRAVAAGVDLAIVSHEIDLQRETLDALTTALLDGTIPVQRLLDARRRLDALRSRLSARDIPPGEDGPDLVRRVARDAVTLVRHGGILPLRISPDQTLGIVTFPSGLITGVEDRDPPPSTLAEAAAVHHSRVAEVQVTGDSHLASLLDRLRHAPTVLAGTAFTTGNPLQRDAVQTLLRAGKRLVILALGDPFDLLSFPDVPCYLALYGDTRPQIDAALAVLFGHAEPRGHLPVPLGDLAPRGHGLTRLSPPP